VKPLARIPKKRQTIIIADLLVALKGMAVIGKKHLNQNMVLRSYSKE
jgi:hypothetical protein